MQKEIFTCTFYDCIGTCNAVLSVKHFRHTTVRSQKLVQCLRAHLLVISPPDVQIPYGIETCILCISTRITFNSGPCYHMKRILTEIHPNALSGLRNVDLMFSD